MNITNDSINEYFKNAGITVSYNSLGATPTLVEAYRSSFRDQVDSSSTKRSQDIKHACYNSMFNFKSRPKLTGFESFKEIDLKFRQKVSPLVNMPFVSSIVETSRPEKLQYKEELLKFTASQKGQDNLIYLSGGLDSELLAYAFLNSNVKFKPIIFRFLDDKHQICNYEEIKHAYAFCAEHNITPFTYDIDIPKLWESSYFEALAVKLAISSPQLVTHAYMISVGNKLFPGHMHFFGGEVRFKTNYMPEDDGQLADLVTLVKTTPSYNGNNYSNFRISPFTSTIGFVLNYSNTGSWTVTKYNSSSAPTTAASGTWTTTPGSSYEKRCTSVTVSLDTWSATDSVSPTAATAWGGIASSTQFCLLLGEAPSADYMDKTVDWTFEVRVVGQTTPVQSSSIGFSIGTEP